MNLFSANFMLGKLRLDRRGIHGRGGCGRGPCGSRAVENSGHFILALALLLPMPMYTPGVVRPLTQSQTCTTRWGFDRRHVTESMKRRVAQNYGIARTSIRGNGACCEFDHLIPRELGGADDVRNLWPQPWAEARMKDRLENALHRRVCAGTISLRDAQSAIRTNWPNAYTTYVGGK